MTNQKRPPLLSEAICAIQITSRRRKACGNALDEKQLMKTTEFSSSFL